MIQDIQDITMVDDIIDIIPSVHEDGNSTDIISDAVSEDGSENVSSDVSDAVSSDDEYEYNDDFIRVDDIGNSVERVVDVLGGIFVASDGATLADVLSRISDTLDRHVAAVEAQTAILEKQSKVLFKLAKVIEAKN
ncbi:hypothetical protein ATCVBr0604L_677L [Acanthocystis turfacea Chlorella virus Br0604L]|nr:hypothetical protein ATCVBr0604L_677L [Acanthocystis turfacea Chlorella virus Br0604L]